MKMQEADCSTTPIIAAEYDPGAHTRHMDAPARLTSAHAPHAPMQISSC
jgi:hypothetical protein